VKIDAFTHVRPEAYVERAQTLLGDSYQGAAYGRPELWHIDARVRHMDEDGIDKQVITHTVPPIEQTTTDPKLAAALAIASNNAILDMASRYPERIIPIGVVSMNNIEAALEEAERCLTQLGMQGILIYTNASGRLLHDPALLPFFEFMSGQKRPIWIHPYYNPNRPRLDYRIEFNIEQVFGWPFDTVVAMTCLIFGGVLDRFPNLTFITHHAGASIPFFEQRMRTHPGNTSQLKRPLLDYYRMFYVDTALQGSIGGLMASCAFYGPDHILFGTDTPYASEDGKGNAKETIASVNALPIPPAQKEQILGGNLRQLLSL
jgi:predicted TIM-barrel fold metal-dependent hydrolase